MPTQQKVRELFTYFPTTGKLIRKIDAAPHGKAGDEITKKLISLEGKMHTVNKIIWLWLYNELPEGRVKFKDGNPNNLRKSNLKY